LSTIDHPAQNGATANCAIGKIQPAEAVTDGNSQLNRWATTASRKIDATAGATACPMRLERVLIEAQG